MKTMYSTVSRRHSSWCMTAAFATVGLTAFTLASSAHAQVAPVLGTVESFAVLGASTVTNTGTSILSGTAANPGNLGVSPGSAITGFPPGILTGPGATIHLNDAVAIQAQIDLNNAYNSGQQADHGEPHGSEPGRPYAGTWRL
jgi:Ice-binding-like